MKCGDFGGETAKGNPCTRAAGWGCDASTGRCKHHRRDAPARAVDSGGEAPDAPPNLSDQARKVWAAVVEEFALAPEALLVLQGALESWDTYREARARLDRDGAVVEGEGAMKRHPAALVARDAFRDYRAALRELGVESLPER